jgi:hypothetical protein
MSQTWQVAHSVDTILAWCGDAEAAAVSVMPSPDQGTFTVLSIFAGCALGPA